MWELYHAPARETLPMKTGRAATSRVAAPIADQCLQDRRSGVVADQVPALAVFTADKLRGLRVAAHDAVLAIPAEGRTAADGDIAQEERSRQQTGIVEVRQ